jgi:hypothetical protein
MARPAPQLIFQDNALLDPAKQGTLLDHIKAAGGRAIQQDVIWGSLRKNGVYDPQAMAALNAEVNAARKRGLGVRFRLMGTPDYMVSSRPGVDAALSAAHPSAALMRQFARDMSSQFAGRVGGYSIWNEPNVQSFLNGSPTQAAQRYRKLFDAGQLGVKEGNRKAKVGFGEITSQSPNDVSGFSTVGFLKNVLSADKHRLHADYATIHPYQWSNPNQRPDNPLYGGISNLQAVQKVLADYARRGRFTTAQGGRVPLSLSEFGYKHDVQPNAGTRAQWLGRAMELARQAGVQDVNMYQMLPSKQGDYWDSSIASPRGKIDARVLRALRKRKARR